MEFGGDWTERKINILVEYAQAYLTIMNNYPFWKLLYFDGFAGSGMIFKDDKIDIHVTIGAARRIIEINHPKPFDKYLFVEKLNKNALELKRNTKDEFPKKNILILKSDCNIELKKVAKILHSDKGKKFRVLAYIDPYGMELEWSSIMVLKEIKLDLWILVPTGLGINRLLTKSGNISVKWLERLEKFLGLPIQEIKDYFYKEKKELTLFGEVTHQEKEKNAIEKSALLYKTRLSEIFDYVTNPYILKNKTSSPMYHLFMASNNKTAVKIANEIIKKYNKME